MSRQTVQAIFSEFDIHEAFLFDLLGRPNYWSAVSAFKDEGEQRGSAYGMVANSHR